LPDPKKGEVQLMKFAKLNNGRLYKLLKGVMDPLSDYQLVLKYNKEIQTRLAKQTTMMEILQIFIRRISLSLINRNIIDVLLLLVKEGHQSKDEGQTQVGIVAEQFIKDISKIFPALYKTQVECFLLIINKEEDLELVTDAVEALSKFVKAFPENTPKSPETIQRLLKYSQNHNESLSKNATIILTKTSANLESVLKTIVKELSVDYDKLLCQFSFIKAIAFYQNEIYQKYESEITNFIINQVLLKNTSTQTEDFVDFNELESEGKCKLLGLKIMIKSLIIDPNESKLEVCKLVLNLVRKILANDGELVDEGQETCLAFKPWLRLQAGLMFLKLVGVKEYAGAFEAMDFTKVGLLIQDQIYHVRLVFVGKLCLAISSGKVPMRYTIWLALAAHEPELELKNKVSFEIINKN
jgi:sister-chromatid-cohesion protein PDS5